MSESLLFSSLLFYVHLYSSLLPLLSFFSPLFSLSLISFPHILSPLIFGAMSMTDWDVSTDYLQHGLRGVRSILIIQVHMPERDNKRSEVKRREEQSEEK